MTMLPTFKHFELTRLADGVYAAIEMQGGAAYSNAGIIDLGDQTLIFDTFDAPQAAQDLKAAAEHLTGHPATCIVNSHWHGDHWSGNQVFARATIFPTWKARYGKIKSVLRVKPTSVGAHTWNRPRSDCVTLWTPCPFWRFAFRT